MLPGLILPFGISANPPAYQGLLGTYTTTTDSATCYLSSTAITIPAAVGGINPFIIASMVWPARESAATSCYFGGFSLTKYADVGYVSGNNTTGRLSLFAGFVTPGTYITTNNMYVVASTYSYTIVSEDGDGHTTYTTAYANSGGCYGNIYAVSGVHGVAGSQLASGMGNRTLTEPNVNAETLSFLSCVGTTTAYPFTVPTGWPSAAPLGASYAAYVQSYHGFLAGGGASPVVTNNAGLAGACSLLTLY